ncbi:transporter [Photobacterium sp. GB-27]|uniref:ComEA family DNA-binding protein n=1 Tax=unclassified Photobacterium TaxID=2628852 RepID=UPI000D1776B1|nr:MULTISPECIES: ComEA family DNA-binding protein [unclassified Photobacterium]PSV24685.1 transporter [Photobacterium sp. GB-56]PSV37936.1 transporter [Photobacterium sp. GB-27]PSV39816.1 transporter [Photobacterium sp. GB-210]PSV42840.1 transporter [Photobacterium sp. GB-36]PSV58538.1 transporter [Photobacterium sp. GB-3]
MLPSRLFKAISLAGGLALASLSYAADNTHEGIDIKININTANVEQLDTLLIGIGAEKAQAIINYRKVHGKFASVDDLTKVKGIGEATVDKNRKRIEL